MYKGKLLQALEFVSRFWRLLLLFLLLSPNRHDCNGVAVDSSGAYFTNNGYDHAGMNNPICWQGTASEESMSNSLLSSSNPFNNNNNNNSPVILSSCPSGTQLNTHLQSRSDELAQLQDGTRLGMANVEYQFNVRGRIDLSQWNTTSVVNNEIGVSMVLCSVGKVRFCSPFVHYETADQQAAGTLGTLHGGTHVDSRFYRVPLIDSSFSVQVSVKVQQPGTFTLVTGAVFLYPSLNNNTILYAAQVAKVVDDYPVIAFWNVNVSRPSKIAALTMIAVAGGIISILLLYTLTHRKAQVLKLAQGNFIIAMLAMALVATVASITFEPRNSLYCTLQGPLVILPLHILFSILLGRLWRIQAVISPLLLLTLERNDTWSDKFVQWMRRLTEVPKFSSSKNQSVRHGHNSSVIGSVRASWVNNVWRRRRDKNQQQQPSPSRNRELRCKVTEGQLVRVVAIFCIPQILAQVLYLILADNHLENGVCPTSFLRAPADGLGGIILLLLFVLLLALARSTKDLPSLFNENEAIWDVALVSIVLLCVSLVVTVITHGPTAQPEIRYIVCTLTVVAITTNTCLKILWPKLRKIWQKEIVVVTKLISDHNRKERSPMVVVMESHAEEETENNGHQHQPPNIPVTFATTDSPAQHHWNTEADDKDDDASTNSSVICTVPEEPTRHQSNFESVDRLESLCGTSVDTLPQPVGSSNSETGRLRTHESFRRNSFGLPSRSSLLSASSYNIPENAPAPTLFHDRIPSSVDSIPESEPSPSQRIGRASRMLRTKSPHSSIVRNRKRFSTNRLGGGSFLTNNSNAKSTRNSTHFSIFRPKNKNKPLLDIGYNPKKINEPIRITVDNPDEPPPRRLLLRMIDVHHTLGLVNRAILSGDQVAQDDWDFLREAVIALGRVFEEDVEFDWDPPDVGTFTLDVPVFRAAQSAPFPRGSFHPPLVQGQRQYQSPRRESHTPSVGSNGISNGGDAVPPTSPVGHGRTAPFSRDRVIAGGGGGVFSGLLQHLPRPSQRSSMKRPSSLQSSHDYRPQGSLARPSSLQQQQQNTPPKHKHGLPWRATSLQPPNTYETNDNGPREDDEESQDDVASPVPRTRQRVLPRSGRSFPRSRYRTSGVATSLQTIQSALSESMVSDDSGLASSRLLRASDNTFASVSTSTRRPAAFSGSVFEASNTDIAHTLEEDDHGEDDKESDSGQESDLDQESDEGQEPDSVQESGPGHEPEPRTTNEQGSSLVDGEGSFEFVKDKDASH